jgi:hypothetical protein
VEGDVFILIQLKSVVFHVATTPNSFTTSKDVGLDVNKKVVNET